MSLLPYDVHGAKFNAVKMRSDVNWRDPHTARRSLAGQIVLKVEGNERKET